MRTVSCWTMWTTFLSGVLIARSGSEADIELLRHRLAARGRGRERKLDDPGKAHDTGIAMPDPGVDLKNEVQFYKKLPWLASVDMYHYQQILATDLVDFVPQLQDSNAEYVMINFYNTWNPESRKLAPYYEKIAVSTQNWNLKKASEAKEHGGDPNKGIILTAAFDCTRFASLCAFWEIKTFPSLMWANRKSWIAIAQGKPTPWEGGGTRVYKVDLKGTLANRLWTSHPDQITTGDMLEFTKMMATANTKFMSKGIDLQNQEAIKRDKTMQMEIALDAGLVGPDAAVYGWIFDAFGFNITRANRGPIGFTDVMKLYRQVQALSPQKQEVSVVADVRDTQLATAMLLSSIARTHYFTDEARPAQAILKGFRVTSNSFQKLY